MAQVKGFDVKDCPFCGSNKISIIKPIDLLDQHVIDGLDEEELDYRENSHIIICDGQYGGCGAKTDPEHDIHKALSIWNERYGEKRVVIAERMILGKQI